MNYQVELREAVPQRTAVVRRRASLQDLPTVLPTAYGEVWEYVRAAELPGVGRNLALYLDDEIHLECGVEVSEPFTGDDKVFCSHLPAGPVAATVHLGPYHRLPEAHQAMRAWCANQGYALAGPNWEIYGHWTDDPEKLCTEVFYLLQQP
jgi:effector-binding domain-containing protein